MARAPFQVLVYPYRRLNNDRFEYALMKRADDGTWQGVAGGGEDDERPAEAARRETYEESGIPPTSEFMQLESIESVPAIEFRDHFHWGEHIFVIPQYAFGVTGPDLQIRISHEHTEYKWFSYAEAYELIKYDGNKTALWELDQRLKGRGSTG